MSTENNLVFVATRVTPDTHRALRVKAAEQNTSLKGLLRKILEEYAND